MGNLDGMFEVQGIPTFIIVQPDGKVVNKSARGLIPDAVAADFPWAPPPVGDIESPEGINEAPALVFLMEKCGLALQQSVLAAANGVAKECAAHEDPEMLFFAAREAGSTSGKIRGMCKLDAASQMPAVVLLDIPDKGGYYVSTPAAVTEGSIRAMIKDWKDKKLERKQLS